jgi:zinc protease
MKTIQRLAAGAALLLAGAALAQPYETPPPPAAPRPLAVAPPQEARLANGLRVVVAERRGLPLVSAQVLVLTGAEADPPGREGLAALTAGLLTRGTRQRSAPALAAAAESLGGTLDSGASWHRSSVGTTVTTPQLGAALALLAEVVRTPAFAPAEIERLRAETLDGITVDRTQPGSVAGLAVQRLLHGSGTYGAPVQGSPASLPRLKRGDVVALHSRHYRPDNAVLVLAGDITLAQARALAERHFGRWRAATRPAAAPAALPATAAASGPPLALLDLGDSGQAAVVLALPAPPAGQPDDAAGAVTNAVLGGGYSSRLNQEIRIRRGLSYGAGSALAQRRHGGVLSLQAQTKNESAAEVLGLLHAQLDSLMATEVPAAELSARQATLIGGFSRSVETGEGLVEQLSRLLAAGQPPTALNGRIAALQAVTAAEVQRYARQQFAPDRRRAAVAGDVKRFEAALRQSEPKLALWPLAALDGVAP